LRGSHTKQLDSNPQSSLWIAMTVTAER